MMRNNFNSEDDDHSNFAGTNLYPSSSDQRSQDIFFTASIAKKSVGEVRNKQKFQETLRQLEEACETTRSSWVKRDLVEQPFSDMGPDCWSSFPPDCLLSSTDFKYFSLSSERTDEEKDLLKKFFRVSDLTKMSEKAHPTKHRLLKYCVAADIILDDLTRRLIVDARKGLTENCDEILENPIIKVIFQELEKLQQHKAKIHSTMLEVAKIKDIPKLAKDVFWQLKRNWNLSINSNKILESQGQLDGNIAKKQIATIVNKDFNFAKQNPLKRKNSNNFTSRSRKRPRNHQYPRQDYNRRGANKSFRNNRGRGRGRGRRFNNGRINPPQRNQSQTD